MFGVIIAIIFIAIFGGVGFFVYRTIKATDPKNYDASVSNTIETAQDFLPFADDGIKDDMIDLGGYQYRMIVEASSTNYNLKTGKEKDLIEISFQRFLNSLTFPVSFFIQTKIIDNSKMLEELQEEIRETAKNFPKLKQYGDVYLREMAELNDHIGNNKEKRKYIIIPYDDAMSLDGLNDEEKRDYVQKELYNRANMIVDGLSAVGIKSNILNTNELNELIYRTYNRESPSKADGLNDGDFLSLMVESENKMRNNMPDDARLDWIIYEAQMRMKTELLHEDLPDFMRETIEDSLANLNTLRDNVGGYYKEQKETYLSTSDDD